MNEKPFFSYRRTMGINLTILYVVGSVAITAIMLVVETEMFLSPVNIGFGVLHIISIIGLWLMTKWGAGLSTILHGMGIAFASWNLQTAYFYPSPGDSMYWFILSSGSIGIVLDVIVAIYLLKWIFENKFK